MIIYEKLHDYLERITEHKQPSTVKRYRYDLLQFIKWLEKTRKEGEKGNIPNENEVSSYYTYLVGLGTYSPNTIRRILSVLCHWMKDLVNSTTVELLKGYIKGTKLNQSNISMPFLKEKNKEKLFKSLRSLKGLTENQKKYRPLMQKRNEVIFRLILFYGLTLQEIATLKINQVHFSANELELVSRKGKRRSITITDEDRKCMFEYYMTIPEPIRPNRYDPLPFFIAFDYQRGTYRWDYENDAPKNWSEVSIQKMIRQELQRSGYPNISAVHLRKTYIIDQLLNGKSKETLKEELVLETTQPLERLEMQYTNES